MPAALEIELVLVFAALLAFAAILLGFLPILRHVWFYSVSRRMFAAVLAVVLGLAVAAVVLVYVAVADPAYFLPIVAVTVGLRIASPALVYARLRDHLCRVRARRMARRVRDPAVGPLRAVGCQGVSRSGVPCGDGAPRAPP